MSSKKKIDIQKLLRKKLSYASENKELVESTSPAIKPVGHPSSVGSGDSMLFEIPLELIDVEEQIRTKYNEDSIGELSQSISQIGLIQPIEVIRNGDRFRIVAGFRRYFAHRKLRIAKIKAIIKIGINDRDIIVRQLIENIQREDIPPIDEAKAMAKILELRNLAQQQLAELIGKSKSYVSEMMGIYKLLNKVGNSQLSFENESENDHGENRSQKVGNSQLLETLNRDTLVKLSRLPETLIETAIKKIIEADLNIMESRKFLSELKEGKEVDPLKIKRKKEITDFCNKIVMIIKGASDNVLRLQIRFGQDLTPDLNARFRNDMAKEIANLQRAINAVMGDDVELQLDLKVVKSNSRLFPVTNSIVTIGDSLTKVGYVFFHYNSSKNDVVKVIKEKMPNLKEQILEEKPLNEIIDQWNALPFQKIEKDAVGFYFNALKKSFNLPQKYLELKEKALNIPTEKREDLSKFNYS